MAHFEHEKFYEAERPDVKLSHSDFMIEPSVNSMDDNLDGLLEYLLLIEQKYKDRLDARNGKMDARFCNEVFNDVLAHFKNKISPVLIIDQICAFFNVDYTTFYNLLDTPNKNLLYKELNKRVSCNTYIRIKQREIKEKTGGCFQPSFKKH